MVAYLLKDARGEFASHDVYDAWEGFQDLGEEVRSFGEAMLHRGVLFQQREDVVVGWVRTVSAAWEQVGVIPPGPVDYPLALALWLCRNLRRATLAALAGETATIFVNPRSRPSSSMVGCGHRAIHGPESIRLIPPSG